MDTFPANIGPYVPERLLGRGAMAAVYLCRDAKGAAVAIKWLDDAHKAMVERFDRECRSLADLQHPGIVGYVAHGEDGGRPYLAMEYVEGTELRVYIEKLHRRPPAERYARCRSIGIALCAALDHLHSRGFVHRDIKPTNVLMADDGRVLLSDLGVVQREGDLEPRHGVLVGTPAYAAPEQADGARVDGRADLFGLGATLYHVLTRRRPFDSIDRTVMPPVPSQFDPGIPADLEAVLMRLLAVDPAQRYTSAREVSAALAAGRDEGIRVAGRQDAVSAAAEALRCAEAGGRVWVTVDGPRGAGRTWLVRFIQRSAARRGVRVVVVEGPGHRSLLEEALAEPGNLVVVAIWDDAAIPAHMTPVRVPMPPLGAADVRRTVVGFAPRTQNAAQVAARLHRLSGGLPALLVPMLQANTVDQAVVLPELVEPPAIAQVALRGTSESTRVVAAILAVLDRPAAIPLIEHIIGPPTTDAIRELVSRGVIVRLDGRVALSAGIFRDVALAAIPNIAALEAKVAAAREDDPTVPGAMLSALCGDAERYLREGLLRCALDTAERAAQLAGAVGDRHLECEARATWGRVLLETGNPKDARRCLADATALARAVDVTDLRRLTHALRAWAELDERRGDPGAAAAALDRLIPLVTNLPDTLSDMPSAIACVVWARAAASLRDRGAWQRAVEQAHARVGAQEDETRARLQLLLAEGAILLNQKEAPDLLAEALSSSAPYPLHSWWGECLQARLDRTAVPPLGPMAQMLTDAQTKALLRRGERAGR